MKQTLQQFMRSHPIGSSLTRDMNTSNELLGVVAKSYRAHAIVSHQGDTDDRIFIVESGWGCLFRVLPNGERQILDTPLKGDIIGMKAIDGPRYATLTALSELSVFELPMQLYARAVERSSVLGNLFMRIAARQHSIAAEHLLNAGRRNAITRTGHFLLELQERLSTFGLTSDHGYQCPLTQHELSDVLGLTTIHVNRTLRDLRTRELVSVRSGFVEFIDRPKLERFSGFDREYLRLT